MKRKSHSRERARSTPGKAAGPRQKAAEAEKAAAGDAPVAAPERLRTELAEVRRLNRQLGGKIADYETFFSNAPVGLAISYDPGCLDIRGNRFFSRFLGLTPLDNLSKSAPAGERPENFKAMRNGRELLPEELPLQMASRGIPVTDAEVDIVHEDGRVVHILGNAIPLFDEQGEPCGAIGAFWDIAELIKTQEALRENEEMLRLATSASEVAIYEYRIDEDAARYNKLYGAVFGRHPAAEAVSPWRSWTDRVHPEDRDRVLSTLREALESVNADTWAGEYRYRRHDGSWAYVRDSAFLERDASGKARRLVGAILDLTERKWVETQLLNANRALEREMAARNAMEREMAKAQKLESLGILAGGIAHDFNNVLTAVMNYIYIAKTSLGPEDRAHKTLEKAQAATVRAQGMTRQLLTFAKGGSPVKERLCLRNLIKDAVMLSLRGSNVKCELRIGRDLWPVEADAVQLGQVISNLVINADQAMPGGGVMKVGADNVVLAGRPLPALADGEYVRVCIEDSGRGIAEEDIPRIFDPFFTTRPDGHGLGLSISHSIVKKHGGLITVDSKVEQGTTFSVYLPASGEAASSEKAGATEAGERGARLLLVDDERMIVDSVSTGLELSGYEVRSAEDGAVAIEMYREAMEKGHPFDAVVIDLTIPGGMGGEATIKRLSELDPEVRAIVASGYSNDRVMSNFRDYGFRGVIAKPYAVKDLIDLLRQVLSRS